LDEGVTLSDVGIDGGAPGVSDIVEVGPVPFAFVAAIVMVYRVPFVRPLYTVEPPILLTVIVGVVIGVPPAVASTTKPSIGKPPVSDGLAHVKLNLPLERVDTKLNGAEGIAPGIPDTVTGVLAKNPFVDTIEKEYEIPFVKPV
jgi:hypothetical protein